MENTVSFFNIKAIYNKYKIFCQHACFGCICLWISPYYTLTRLKSHYSWLKSSMFICRDLFPSDPNFEYYFDKILIQGNAGILISLH